MKVASNAVLANYLLIRTSIINCKLSLWKKKVKKIYLARYHALKFKINFLM